jgi:dipeptide transport system substrate-binding protein
VKGGTNESQWCHKELDDAVGAARRTVDRNERIALYRKAQRIVYDEVPLIPLADPPYFMAVNRKVKGFITGPGADMDFRGVRVDEK